MFYRIEHSGFVDKHGATRPANRFHAKGETHAAVHVLQLATAGALDASMNEVSEGEYRTVCRAALAQIRRA